MSGVRPYRQRYPYRPSARRASQRRPRLPGAPRYLRVSTWKLSLDASRRPSAGSRVPAASVSKRLVLGACFWGTPPGAYFRNTVVGAFVYANAPAPQNFEGRQCGRFAEGVEVERKRGPLMALEGSEDRSASKRLGPRQGCRGQEVFGLPGRATGAVDAFGRRRATIGWQGLRPAETWAAWLGSAQPGGRSAEPVSTWKLNAVLEGIGRSLATRRFGAKLMKGAVSTWKL